MPRIGGNPGKSCLDLRLPPFKILQIAAAIMDQYTGNIIAVIVMLGASQESLNLDWVHLVAGTAHVDQAIQSDGSFDGSIAL